MVSAQRNHVLYGVNGLRACVLGVVLVVFWTVVSGCSRTPGRFDTPVGTVQALFEAYGVKDATEEEVTARFAAQERFAIVDQALYRACFVKWRGDFDEGLGGYVFGRLVARKDHLRIEQDGDTATVTADGEVAGTLGVQLRKIGKQWKIDMLQSVPEDIRTRLYDVHRRARRQERGAP